MRDKPRRPPRHGARRGREGKYKQGRRLPQGGEKESSTQEKKEPKKKLHQRTLLFSTVVAGAGGLTDRGDGKAKRACLPWRCASFPTEKGCQIVTCENQPSSNPPPAHTLIVTPTRYQIPPSLSRIHSIFHPPTGSAAMRALAAALIALSTAPHSPGGMATPPSWVGDAVGVPLAPAADDGAEGWEE